MGLRWSLQRIMNTAISVQRRVIRLKNLYAAADVRTKSDGTLPYPNPDTRNEEGMGLELR